MTPDDYIKIMPDLARKFWGPENPKLTKMGPPMEIWWGDRGSRSVNLDEGTWYDFRQDIGGGVIDFLREFYGVPKAAAIDWLRKEGFDVPKDQPKNSSGKGERLPQKITAKFAYVDELGKPMFEVVRLEDGTLDSKTGKKNKTFGQRFYDPKHPQAKKDGWVWTLKGRRRVLYRLPQVVAAIKAGKRINFFEGEKAVETAVEHLGLEATCNPMGAGKWEEGYTESLRDADLLIVPDLDPEGLNHADVVASSAVNVARRVRVLLIPGLTTKEDIYEFVHKHGGTPEKFEELVEEYATVWMPKPPQSAFGAVTMRDLDGPGPEYRWRIKGLLADRGVAVMAGPSGSGKSFVATDMGFCIATGRPYQGRKTEPGVVLYQAGEGGIGLKKRMRAYRQDKLPDNIDPSTVPFVLLPGRFNLHNSDDAVENFITEGKAWAAYYRLPIGAIFIDTFATATVGANENDAGDVGKILEKAQRIAEALETVVLIVHHMNKGGESIRGSGAILANVENTFLVQKLDTIDANNRVFRKVTVLKNKEGEDGASWQFVIRQVDLGFDNDGAEISSCVIDEPSTGQIYETTGLKLNDSEMVVYDALTRALEDFGDSPKMSPMIPKTVKRAVKYAHVRDMLEKTWPYTPDHKDPPEEQIRKRREAVRKVLERIGKKLTNNKVVGVDYEAQIMWLTGAPIIGRTARRKNAAGNTEAEVHRLEEARKATAARLDPDEDLGWT